MPAKSKSQQRLFGMVHAYQKGEFHGSRGLRALVAGLARHVSESDARHFAETPHAGLPEKKAQATLRPDQAEELARYLALYAPPVDSMTRSVRRKSFLSRIVPGALVGAAVGGVGVGGIGAYLAHRAARGSGVDPQVAADRIREAALSCGLWGAGRGAIAGAAAGVGLGVLDKVRGQ